MRLAVLALAPSLASSVRFLLDIPQSGDLRPCFDLELMPGRSMIDELEACRLLFRLVNRLFD